MNAGWAEKLKKRYHEIAQESVAEKFDKGEYSAVLELLGEPTTPKDREMAAHCHYALLKEACADGNYQSAHNHATGLLRINLPQGSLRAARTFTQERLAALKDLLRNPLAAYDTSLPSHLTPGIAYAEYGLRVPVLGRYNPYGHGEPLHKLVQHLKVPADEIAVWEEQTRPLFDRLGYEFVRLLSRCPNLKVSEIDVIIPIPRVVQTGG